MGFMKAKKPKEPEFVKEDPQEVAEKTMPNPAGTFAETQSRESKREAKRQGWAASMLTGPRGLSDRKNPAATRALLGA